MSYGFRIRFKFPAGARLPIEETNWTVDRGDSGAKVEVVSIDQVTPICDASEAALLGSGYETAQDAQVAGKRWRNVAQVAFARLNIGVDFYERSTELAGGFTEYGLAQLSQEHGRPVANDQPGLVVYEEPRPLFASSKADAVVRPSVRRATATFTAARNLVGLDISPRERMAFDLYSASFFEPAADTRLLMAMMAIEALIDPQPRRAEVRSLVEGLMVQVQNSGLPRQDTSSLLGSMKWLLDESIGQAGRRVVSDLGDRKYMGKSPAQLFTKCYNLRSALVHGHLARPERSEVDVHAAHLQTMVGELLGRRLLHVTEEWLDERDGVGNEVR